MKRTSLILLVVCLLLGTFALPAFASVSAKPSAATADVYVTIADGSGKLAMTQEKVIVTDRDGDGKFSIDEALYAAHEAKYSGGAAAGYASVGSEWGLSLQKLWGVENGGSYGYYVNRNMAMGLTDEVKDGDYIAAFVYTDTTAWSDVFCFFDQDKVACEAGEEVTLTLSQYQWDMTTGETKTVAVAGATITVNGEKTDYKTDESGRVTIQLEESGEIVISATSETLRLVPPVCMASVEGGADYTVAIVIVLVAVVVVAGVVAFLFVKNKHSREE